MGDPIVATSRTAIREGSKSFSLAAALFDRSCREDAYQLYAWCRRCDDEIDGQHLGHGPAASAAADVSPGKRLARLRRLTDLALGGVDVDDPAFAALGRVARRHRIPQRYPRELLDGFAMDVDGRQYLVTARRGVPGSQAGYKTRLRVGGNWFELPVTPNLP